MEILESINGSLSNPEIWKPIPGFPGYEASDLGQIRSSARTVKHPRARELRIRGRVLRPRLDKSGYQCVTPRVGGITVYRTVHSLIALAFLGERPQGLVVNHIDHDRRNNRLTNLEYCTIAQNAQYSAEMRRKLKAQNALQVSV